MNFQQYFVIAVYGLMFGSFFNVCIYRIPRGLSIVHPRSRCRRCKSEIPWYRNIPVVSYLALRGRCAVCKTDISFIYPFVEILTAVVTVLVFRRFYSPDPARWLIPSMIYFVFAGGLIVLSFIDLRFFIIPDRFTLGGMLFGIFFSACYPALHGYDTAVEGAAHSLGSGLILFGVLYAVRTLGSLFYGREAMGFGDVKLAGALGAFLGWKLGLLSLFFGALAGSVIGIVLLVATGMKMRAEIPFGPYLSLGALGALLFGKTFLSWYLATMSWT
jgi:leader peptidase (prepilin peptidase)/N-methyltransferase